MNGTVDGPCYGEMCRNRWNHCTARAIPPNNNNNVPYIKQCLTKLESFNSLFSRPLDTLQELRELDLLWIDFVVESQNKHDTFSQHLQCQWRVTVEPLVSRARIQLSAQSTQQQHLHQTLPS